MGDDGGESLGVDEGAAIPRFHARLKSQYVGDFRVAGQDDVRLHLRQLCEGGLVVGRDGRVGAIAHQGGCRATVMLQPRKSARRRRLPSATVVLQLVHPGVCPGVRCAVSTASPIRDRPAAFNNPIDLDRWEMIAGGIIVRVAARDATFQCRAIAGAGGELRAGVALDLRLGAVVVVVRVVADDPFHRSQRHADGFDVVLHQRRVLLDRSVDEDGAVL